LMAIGRILVVDDEAPVREVLAEYFATEGYAVEAAGSGVEALTVVRGGRADLVLLDVRMPGLDGVQILRQIRAFDERVPVIMVTANEDVGLAKETLRLGAFDYVAKPFDFDYLDRAVAAGLSRMGDTTPAGGATKDDPWMPLTRAAFSAARAMQPPARTSTGERIEAAALAAARNATAGRCAIAGEHLSEMKLLLDVAAEFGDLPAADRALVESAIEAARRSLPAAG
jgi:two-component system response regulator (stage 0 sporulation protein F)